jgi:uncharacterized protein YggT (Ycf19 family)
MLLLIMIFDYLALAITVVTGALAALLVLRMVLQWAGVNPFGWFALNLRKLTEPIMRPFRFGFDNQVVRFDMLPIVAAALVLINGLFAAWIVGQVSFVLRQFYMASSITVGLVLSAIVWFAVVGYMAALFARFLLPMLGFRYSSRFLRFAFLITEPILKPLRRYLVLGAFDFSPVVVIFAVQILGTSLCAWLARL